MNRREAFRNIGAGAITMLCTVFGLQRNKFPIEPPEKRVRCIQWEMFQQLPEHATEIGSLSLPGVFQKQKDTCKRGETVFFAERTSSSYVTIMWGYLV